jgi:hypothetical protein
MGPKSKFTELIAVRLTNQELARLQEAAEEQGIGASTLVRILINQVLKPASSRPRRITADEFQEVIASTLSRMDKGELDVLLKDVSIGDPENPMLLVWAGQDKKYAEFTSHFLKALLASLGIEVSLPENKKDSIEAKKTAVELEDKRDYAVSKKEGGR